MGSYLKDFLKLCKSALQRFLPEFKAGTVSDILPKGFNGCEFPGERFTDVF